MALLNFGCLILKILLVLRFLAVECNAPEDHRAAEQFVQVTLLNVTGIIRSSNGDNPSPYGILPLNQLDFLGNGQTSMILLDKSTSGAILDALRAKAKEVSPEDQCSGTEVARQSWNDGHPIKLRRTKGGHGSEMENGEQRPNWLERLFGFDRRPPAEFFREYHVHILWELIFHAIRWLFFYGLSFFFEE